MKRVLLVVPAHNRPEEIRTLFSSVTHLERDNFDLIIAVVDDGSVPPIRAEIENEFAYLPIRFFRNETACGPAYCRNLACRSINSDFVWFLDSDTKIINPKVMLSMIEKLEADSEIGGIGGPIEYIDGTQRILKLSVMPTYLFVYSAFPPDQFKPSRLDALATCNLMLRRELFDKVGGFDEHLPRNEDMDFCLSFKKMGKYFYQDKNTVVVHLRTSTGRNSGQFQSFSDTKSFVRDMQRTRVILMLKHKPLMAFFWPIVDIFVGLKMFALVKLGVYHAGHLEHVKPASKISWVYYLAYESAKAYLYGVRHVLKENWLSSKRHNG